MAKNYGFWKELKEMPSQKSSERRDNIYEIKLSL
jgi:hypothetical protein